MDSRILFGKPSLKCQVSTGDDLELNCGALGTNGQKKEEDVLGRGRCED